MLQILLGIDRLPGGFRFKPPYPSAAGPPAQAAWRWACRHAACRPASGLPRGPEDLLLEADGGRRSASTRPFPGMRRCRRTADAHGDLQRACGDPYGIDVLFMYMANMAWNSSMNTPAVMEMLTDKDEKTGEYVIPKIIYSDAYSSEMVAYADLILPDTTYLERTTASRCSTGRSASPRRGRFDPLAGGRAGPRRARLPDRAARSRCAAGLPGMVNEDMTPVYKDYADYIVNHERKPGIGPLAGWRGEDGRQDRQGRSPTRTSSSATSRMAASQAQAGSAGASPRGSAPVSTRCQLVSAVCRGRAR
jgi:anaerobic selenocysteine-containing dehydrogenase